MDAGLVKQITDFNVSRTFDCGQTFRFHEENGILQGVALGELLTLRQEGNILNFYHMTEEDYRTKWKSYLTFDEDYDKINEDIRDRFDKYNDVMEKAIRVSRGIRILRQDPWETLCSFILSQNNNIPRIMKIVESLCTGLGEEKKQYGQTFHAFPSAEAIYEAGPEYLNTLRMGYRSRYLYDAAKRVAKQEMDLSIVPDMPLEESEKYLMQICGVGKKVADCVLLYGFHKTESFPVDVWIRRVIGKYYPEGLDFSDLGPYAGIAQQYLFYYERYNTKSGE